MTMRRKRTALITITLLVGLLAVPIILTWREFRQERLNHSLIAAAVQNDASRVRSLLQQGASPDTIVPSNHRSVSQWLFDRVLHRSQPSIGSDIDRASVLMLVIYFRGKYGASYATAEALLNDGANPNYVGGYLGTPLQVVIRRREWKTLALLFGHHADVNLPDLSGKTPLMEAAFWTDTQMAQTILQRGAKINMKDDKGHTALWYALRMECQSFSDLGNESPPAPISEASIRATVACLLRHGASVNGRDSDSKTILESACECGNDPQLIQMFKQAGAQK
jgi:hypothetical protein